MDGLHLLLPGKGGRVSKNSGLSSRGTHETIREWHQNTIATAGPASLPTPAASGRHAAAGNPFRLFEQITF
ncbi:MAG: hypothetical protein EA425_06590 [Puniceicoccaceae bacterium]|nr:MAG: hypothetical protein EA425_06590 [Puniceicoccaceae bacterium]